MKKRIGFWMGVALLAAVALSLDGCRAVREFLAKDLESPSDEDWIIGKLYEDEYVQESPYQPATPGSGTVTAPAGASAAAQSLAAIRTAADDGALYDALMPWMGVPYKYGGTTKKGVDCSAFVGAVYKTRYGVELHRTANDMQQDVTFIKRNELQAGDILFFTNSNGKVAHVGIYLKDVTFVHASTSSGVILSRFDTGYWSKRLYRCGRVKLRPAR
ncbi:MAG: lipoprotein Spr [bacterium P3]|nr:MAG: lipoprotein Spr [bacterium P3]KWW42764.1 MAG: lipoprotein Spr [bacterium F083]